MNNLVFGIENVKKTQRHQTCNNIRKKKLCEKKQIIIQQSFFQTIYCQ